jgi:hypothetical protein
MTEILLRDGSTRQLQHLTRCQEALYGTIMSQSKRIKHFLLLKLECWQRHVTFCHSAMVLAFRTTAI